MGWEQADEGWGARAKNWAYLTPIQVAREGDGPRVMSIYGSLGGFDQGLVWARHLRGGG